MIYLIGNGRRNDALILLIDDFVVSRRLNGHTSIPILGDFENGWEQNESERFFKSIVSKAKDKHLIRVVFYFVDATSIVTKNTT